MNPRSNRRTERENNRIIAGLLAFVGGIFGIHKFYLNDIGGGIFYLFLFFITIKFFPVTLILGIIEAMRLFNMDPEEFDAKYNKGKLSGRERRWQSRSRTDFRRDRTSEQRRDRVLRTNGHGQPDRARYTRKDRPVLKRNPFKSSGMEKYRDFDLDDAIADFHKALKISEQDPDIHFYLAAAYSLTEQKDKAFHHLSLAVQYGLKDLEKIETFEDLAFVRIQEEYDAFKNNGFRLKTPAEKITEKPGGDILEDDILLSQLNKLAELRNRGLISEEEFLIEKEKLIETKK